MAMPRSRSQAKRSGRASKPRPRRGSAPRRRASRPSGPRGKSGAFPIVGVGASAGGLEAFTQLLSDLPADSGMAFVLVQHLDPKRDSLLKEILGRSTRMPVLEVADAMRAEADRVYVIPSNADIRLVNGSFRVERRTRRTARERAIDHFFFSLADGYGPRAIGIVLSGSMSDGALGLRAIKAEGGVTFAQDEETARFHDMPRAAIAAGAVDFVGSPRAIAGELARMATHPYVRPRTAPTEPPASSDSDYARILAILRNATHVDFSGYRQSTVRRRIARRMALRKEESLAAYADLLRRDPAESFALHEDILITVTAFFRDPEVFESLQGEVFPALLRGRPREAAVRIWVPGCSTGEEVYSLAIALFETVEDSDSRPSVHIFATDISETAIDKARAGLYLENAVADVSPGRLKRFFVRVDKGWQVSRTIRDACVFARHNLATDPPFSNLDLVSCRNLLIYMESALQKRVIPLLHYGLRPSGYLLLGNAETISGFGDLFVPVDRNRRIFTRRPGPPRPLVDFARATPLPEPAAARRPPDGPPVDLQKEADRLVLGRYGPAGVVVDDAGNVVQFRGRTGAYLEAPPGVASLNVMKMAREGLLADLRSGLLKARRSGKAIRREKVRVRRDGHTQTVDLEVVPLTGDGPDSRHYLVLFEETPPSARRTAPPSRPAPASRDGRATIAQLEQELAETREHLQAIVETTEAANEELKSANEEILSSNEELQSTNEELETAKEELQSTNEELTTVNEEMQNRNAELIRLNDDLLNLLTGVRLPIVMLDREGRLRRFTPPAEKLLNLIAADTGRRIRDIRPNLKAIDLQAVVSEVIRTGEPRELEIQDDQERWLQMHVRPYRTADKRIDGAVLAFFDIDPIKKSLEQVHRARRYAEALVETIREAIVVVDSHLRVRTANQSFHRNFGTVPDQVEGRPLLELWNLKAADSGLRKLLEGAIREKAPIRDHDLTIEIAGAGERTLRLNGRRVRLPGEAEPLVLLAFEDFTERRRAEEALRSSEFRYRRIFETAREGIWLADAATGELLDANPYLEELLGYPRSELVGQAPWDLGVFEDAAAARARFARAVEEGFHLEPEVALRNRGGQTVLVEAVLYTYRLGDRLVLQANLRDLTERFRLQNQVRQMQKLDSVGRLAGGVAHDFNNLLNIISAHAELLSRTNLAADRRAGSSHSIRKAVERGTAVVRQLLTFARKTDVAFEPTDVNGVVRELELMLRETFPKQIKIATKLARRLPRIHADPNQLHQAVLNLAVNARDAMPRGGVLTLGTDVVTAETLRAKFPEAAGGRFVELCVADTGQGMARETRERMFEPFFSTKGTGGQGLGLSVVYGIVNSHRGFVDVESEIGKGTTVRIYVAAAVGRRTSPGPVKGGRRGRPRAAPSPPPAGRTPATVLIVEDEQALLDPIREILEEEGFEVLTAHDGLEAVRCHAENADRIGAVLLDLGLPRLAGWQAFLRMRERDPGVRCIVASGNIDSERRKAMEEAGVRATVRKPYGSAEILRVVRDVLAG